jgi:hypothetical protein
LEHLLGKRCKTAVFLAVFAENAAGKASFRAGIRQIPTSERKNPIS